MNVQIDGLWFCPADRILCWAAEPPISGHVVYSDCVCVLLEVDNISILARGPVVVWHRGVSLTDTGQQNIGPLPNDQAKDLDFNIFWRDWGKKQYNTIDCRNICPYTLGSILVMQPQWETVKMQLSHIGYYPLRGYRWPRIPENSALENILHVTWKCFKTDALRSPGNTASHLSLDLMWDVAVKEREARSISFWAWRFSTLRGTLLFSWTPLSQFHFSVGDWEGQ